MNLNKRQLIALFVATSAPALFAANVRNLSDYPGRSAAELCDQMLIEEQRGKQAAFIAAELQKTEQPKLAERLAELRSKTLAAKRRQKFADEKIDRDTAQLLEEEKLLVKRIDAIVEPIQAKAAEEYPTLGFQAYLDHLDRGTAELKKQAESTRKGIAKGLKDIEKAKRDRKAFAEMREQQRLEERKREKRKEELVAIAAKQKEVKIKARAALEAERLAEEAARAKERNAAQWSWGSLGAVASGLFLGGGVVYYIATSLGGSIVNGVERATERALESLGASEWLGTRRHTPAPNNPPASQERAEEKPLLDRDGGLKSNGASA